MKKLKTTLLAITIGLFISAGAQAQQKEIKDAKPVAEKESTGKLMAKGKMEERLALTAEQRVSYKEIVEKYKQKMKDLKTEKKEEDREGKMKAVKALQADKDAEIKSLLTESQYKTYEEMKAEKKANKK